MEDKKQNEIILFFRYAWQMFTPVGVLILFVSIYVMYFLIEPVLGTILITLAYLFYHINYRFDDIEDQLGEIKNEN